VLIEFTTDDATCKGMLSKEVGGIVRNYTYYTNTCQPKDTVEKIGASTYTNTVTYTDKGLLDTLQYPSHIKLKYEYTNQGYLEKTKNASNGDVYQEITAMDAWGNWTQAYHGGTAGKVTRQYDERSGQMTNTKWFDGGVRNQEYTYQYKEFGNLDDTTNFTYGFGTFIESFDYDNLHRLTQSTNRFSNGSTSINYKFAENGNLLRKSDFSWNANNAYEYKTAKDSTYKAGPHAPWRVRDAVGTYRYYYYDNNGNMVTEKHGTATVRTVAYNALNKPTKIRIHNGRKLHPKDPHNGTSGTTIDFEYGPNWSRFQQKRYLGTALKETTQYLMGGAYEHINRNGNIKKRITIGNHTVVNIKGSNVETNALHKDRLGSTIGIASTLGNLVESFSFDPFGRPRDGGYKDRWRAGLNSQMYPNSNSGTAKDSYDKRVSRGFTDHEQLDDVQYTHMNGRIYDYNLGRFLSVDPFIQSPGNSQSLNPYSYIMNNPLAGTDPSGYISNGVRSLGSELPTQSQCGAGSYLIYCDRARPDPNNAINNIAAGRISSSGGDDNDEKGSQDSVINDEEGNATGEEANDSELAFENYVSELDNNLFSFSFDFESNYKQYYEGPGVRSRSLINAGRRGEVSIDQIATYQNECRGQGGVCVAINVVSALAGSPVSSLAGRASAKLISSVRIGPKVVIKSVDDLPLVSPTYAELKAINAGTKLQAHHIMPQYLGKMLGYTKKDMLDHPATLITQFSHTGKINPNAMHKAISKYLPPMVGGKNANYTADQIRSGLQSAYSDIGRPELFKSVSHLIK
jgi:RHS repeat-associated protein